MPPEAPRIAIFLPDNDSILAQCSNLTDSLALSKLISRQLLTIDRVEDRESRQRGKRIPPRLVSKSRRFAERALGAPLYRAFQLCNELANLIHGFGKLEIYQVTPPKRPDTADHTGPG